MNWEFNLYSIILLVAAIITALLAGHVSPSRAIPGAIPFFFLLLSVAAWSLGYSLEIATPNFPLKLLSAKMQYIGIVGVPLFWLIYTIQFTGKSGWLSRRNRLLLVIIPVVTLLLAWTNEWHGLIWAEIEPNTQGPFHDLTIQYGPWFWLNTLYSYLLMLSGTFLLVRFFIRSQGLFRRQIGIVLLAAFVPWLGNAFYLFGINPMPDLDLTPFAFTITGLLMAWGFLRLQFLDIVPLARHALVEGMDDGVFVIDTRNRIVDINPAAQALFSVVTKGVSEGGITSFIGQTADQIFRNHLDLIQRFKNVKEAREVLTAEVGESHKYFELRITPLYGRQNEFSGRLIMVQDITEREQAKFGLLEAHRELEERVQERTVELATANEALLHKALHDALTGLPNRRLFMDRLDLALERAKRYPGKRVAVLFMDLDRFKLINDSLGHASGDAFLIEIAQRLKNCLRSIDTIARFGGDEFAVLLDDIVDTDEVLHVAERIQHELLSPFQVDGHEVFSSASIGIALSSESYRNPTEILRDADAAMYEAKAVGRGRHEIFNVDMHAQNLSSLQMQSELRHAIEQEEFEVYYQPIIDLATWQVVSVEALLRWRHPQRGMLLPKEFLDLAEENRMITNIDEWVLRTVCYQAKLWHDCGYSQLRVAVNISPRQFQEKHILDILPSILSETGLEPGFLELEIGEETVMKDIEVAIRTLVDLNQIGVHITIDDFGMGYSSLNYLKYLQGGSLKIDRSFIQDAMKNQNDASIVSAIIAMAHILKINVVAEGVEKKEQLEFLRSQKCDNAQGFLFSPPLNKEEISNYLQMGKIIKFRFRS